MGTIFDYLAWRGDIKFNKSEFNNIDNLIFAEISYVDFSDAFKQNDTMTLKEAVSKSFKDKKDEDIVLGLIVPQAIVKMTRLASSCNRFKNVKVSDYENIIKDDPSTQFSAMCFHIDNDTIYIAIRGTDDTLLGWQENLDMVANFPVPAQKLSLKYLEKIAKKYEDKKIYIGGQSKGGNLAFYAAMYAPKNIQDRIIMAYSNDGPGFIKSFIDNNKYEKIKDKLTLIIPQSCVVGLLFDLYYGKMIIVKSNQKGVKQHDSLSWQCLGASFVEAHELSKNALKLNDDIDKLLYKLSFDERKDLASSMYDFIKKVKKDTLIECQKDPFSLLTNLNKIPYKNRKVLTKFVTLFIKNKQA